MAQSKVAIAGGIGLIGLAAWVAFEYRATMALKEENAALRQTAAQVADLQAANDQLSNRLAQADVPGAGQSDLLRLRGEVAMLRRQTNELERLRTENARLRDALGRGGSPPAQTASEPDPSNDPARAAAIAKMNDARALVMAAIQYAAEHKDAFPTAPEQFAPYLQKGDNKFTGTNDFDLVLPSGAKVTNPSQTIMFREQQAWQSPTGKWDRTYGFVDGHVETHGEPDLNALEAWEQQRIVAAPPATQ